MPYSPFTRFLAGVLVVLVALGLLWPDDRALEWSIYGAGAMAILLGIFTWSAVKNSPPLDDRAFQRCLPAGANRAFFRIVWIHLLVLAGAALAVLVYCGIWNFTWRAASWGVAMLTIPAWALMSAVGVASSAGSSQQHWKSVAWISIFATPLFSAGLLYWLNQGVGRYEWENVYFTPVRTMVLTAATLYPLVWWLVAARQRRGLGLVLGGATSALLPWLVVYGDFAKAPVEIGDRQFGVSPAGERLTLTRKPFAGSDRPWIPVEDLIEVQGLAEGDYTRMSMAVQFDKDDERQSREDRLLAKLREREYLRGYEIRDESDREGDGIRNVLATVSNQGGKIVWGADAVNQSIRKLLPEVETFGYWRSTLNRPASPPVIRNPAAPNARPGDTMEERPYYSRLSPEGFRTMPWSVWMMNPGRWKLLGSCLTSEGTSFRLEKGRMLKVLPLVQRPEGNDTLNIRCYFESLWQTKGPWFGGDVGPNWSGFDLVVVAIDETGKHAYLIDESNHGNTDQVMLGRYERMIFNMDPATSAADWQRIEMLRKSRLYIFTSKAAGFPKVMELPGLGG